MRAALTFITGPVRAGKSTLAERLARESGLPVTYCATAANDRDDAEWAARIEHHREQRPASWNLCESAGPRGVDLIAKLEETEAGECLLIESLGTWIADAMGRGSVTDGGDVMALHRDVGKQADGLVQAIVESRATTIVVSEEVGWGVVPAFPSGRIFRDVIARANRTLVAAAGRAYLVVSGVAFDLKTATPIDRL